MRLSVVVLHRILYPKVHKNGFEKKKKDNKINHVIKFKKYWEHINLIGNNDFRFSNAYF